MSISINDSTSKTNSNKLQNNGTLIILKGTVGAGKSTSAIKIKIKLKKWVVIVLLKVLINIVKMV